MYVQLIPMKEGALLTLLEGVNILGRGEDCTVRIAHDSISDRHCSVQCVPGAVIVRDFRTMNTTLVNGQEIQRISLNDGDELQLGLLNYRVRIGHESSQRVLQEASSTPREEFELLVSKIDTISAPKRNRSARGPSTLTDWEVPGGPSETKTARDFDQPSVEGQENFVEYAESRCPPVDTSFRTVLSANSGQAMVGSRSVEPQTLRMPAVNRTADRTPVEPSRLAVLIDDQRNPLLIVLVCGIILAVYCGIPWSTLGQTSDETYFRFYTDTLERIDELSSQEAAESKWQSLKAEIDVQNEAWVRELEKTASSRRLARQRLLFAGRDYLPKVFTGVALDRARAVTKLRETLDEVRLMLDDPVGYEAARQERALSADILPVPGGALSIPMPGRDPSVNTVPRKLP